ncbi:sulfotransferase [uncultured Aliiroseovarius sp.]|uniref:sulfotransferase n=1 Tax=uncultured Aliiroseovarius sp. TaxID=1658783 RepID=UPI00259AD86C|nr:sulfotransferase [uncultured Aliiroseovarius sp.]
MFDETYYRDTYPDLAGYKGSLYGHYKKHGWREGRNPNPLFDSLWYAQTYLGENAEENPLSHYERIGWKLGLNPSAIFDARWFRENYMTGQVGIDPLVFYIERAAEKGISPHPLINVPKYLEDNQDVPKDTLKALNHVLYEGFHGVRAAVPGFDPEHYRSKNPDIADYSDPDTWRHFLVHGRKTHGVFWPRSLARPKKRDDQTTRPADVDQLSPLIIAGFHRSGTSMTANLLLNAGLHLGDRLLGANYSNPRGHFEDVEIIAFHDRLLARADRNWMVSDPFEPILLDEDREWIRNYASQHADQCAWGFKDPRVTLFLPQWMSVLPNASVLYVHRPCVECVHSIKRRAANWARLGKDVELNTRFWTQEDLAVKMYLTYAEAALDFLESFDGRACVVALDDILSGRDIVQEIKQNWGYDLVDSKITDIYDAASMSRVGPNEYLHDMKLMPRIEQVESRFLALANRGFNLATEKEAGAK